VPGPADAAVAGVEPVPAKAGDAAVSGLPAPVEPRPGTGIEPPVDRPSAGNPAAAPESPAALCRLPGDPPDLPFRDSSLASGTFYRGTDPNTVPGNPCAAPFPGKVDPRPAHGTKPLGPSPGACFLPFLPETSHPRPGGTTGKPGLPAHRPTRRTAWLDPFETGEPGLCVPRDPRPRPSLPPCAGENESRNAGKNRRGPHPDPIDLPCLGLHDPLSGRTRPLAWRDEPFPRGPRNRPIRSAFRIFPTAFPSWRPWNLPCLPSLSRLSWYPCPFRQRVACPGNHRFPPAFWHPNPGCRSCWVSRCPVSRRLHRLRCCRRHPRRNHRSLRRRCRYRFPCPRRSSRPWEAWEAWEAG